MIRFSILLSGLFSFFYSPGLEAYTVQSQSFDPFPFQLGQIASLRFSLELGEGETVRPIPQLISNLEYRIHHIRLNQVSNAEVTIVLDFSVYTDELVQIPPQTFGNITLPAVSLPKAAKIPTGAEDLVLAENYSEPVTLPWIDLIIALIIQAIILLPIGLFHLYKFIRPFGRRLSKRILQKRPYYQFLRQLSVLQGATNLSSAEYYRIVSSQVRHYLSLRVDSCCKAYTTEEICALPLPVQDEPVWKNLLEVMRTSDRVRFGRRKLSRNNRKQEIQVLVDFAKRLEKAAND